jgi:protein SCO1
MLGAILGRVAANDPSVSPAGASLKRLRRVLVLAVAALAAVAAVLYFALRPSSETPMTVVPASETPAATWAAGTKRAPGFSLRGASGAPLSLASFRGRPVIVTFIDPLCRDYCPTEAKRLNDVANSFPGAQKPAIVAVSVNVYGNARSVLREDARKWSLVPQWHWAVGAHTDLARAWNAYHIQVIVSSKTIAGVTVHRIGHTEAAYLIDANGYQRALFLWPYTSSAVVHALRGLTAS